MQAAADWIKEHPEAKVNVAELFDCSPQEVSAIALNEPRRVIDFAEALATRATMHGAPPEVMDGLSDLTERLRAGIAAIERGDPFTKKMLASLAGLEDPQEIRLVLRGAFPHTPTEAENDLIKRLDETLDNRLNDLRNRLNDPLADPGAGLKGGGSWWGCILGCLACLEFCLICCTILFEGDDAPMTIRPL
jgi:hypothetical protein